MKVAVDEDLRSGRSAEHTIDPVAPPRHQLRSPSVDEARKAPTEAFAVRLSPRVNLWQITDDAGDVQSVQAYEEGRDLARHLCRLRPAEAARPLPAQWDTWYPPCHHESGLRAQDHQFWNRQGRLKGPQPLQHHPLPPQPNRPDLGPRELHDEAVVDHRARRPPQRIRLRMPGIDPDGKAGEVRGRSGQRRSQRLFGSVLEPAHRHDR